MKKVPSKPGLKHCSYCDETKSVSHFGADKSRRDGLAFRCILCTREAHTDWRLRTGRTRNPIGPRPYIWPGL